MDSQNDDKTLESRFPEIHDLVNLCREFNRLGAKYIVIGGMAIIQTGYGRSTKDIDFLIESSSENQEKVKKALLILPDKAVLELGNEDFTNYTVIRIADEVVVDILTKACGIDYEEAKDSINFTDIFNVNIPFAKPELLWKTKQTLREQDQLDLMFLKDLIERK
jgi:hypothetical protein